MKLLVLSLFVLVAVTLSQSYANDYDEDSIEILSHLRSDENIESSTLKEGRWNKTKNFFKKKFNSAKNWLRSDSQNTTTEVSSGLERIDIIDDSSNEIPSTTTETIGFWKRVKNIW